MFSESSTDTTWSSPSVLTGTSAVQVSTPLGPLSPLPVKLTSLTNTNLWTKGGIMVRDGTKPNAYLASFAIGLK